MLKQLIAIVSVALATAFALPAFAVEVNSADKAALDGVKDIGPKTAEAIIAERSKGGKFKNWDDLIERVKGIGDKNSAAMSAAGLTVNGQSKPNVPASKSAEKKKDSPKSDAGAGGKPESTATAADDKKGKRDAKKDKSDDKPESKK
jgi:competence protein ComEA